MRPSAALTALITRSARKAVPSAASTSKPLLSEGVTSSRPEKISSCPASTSSSRTAALPGGIGQHRLMMVR
jgi:hypothetical protein